MYTVSVSFEDADLQPLQIKWVIAGQTLLEVLLENKVDIHHDCGGVCYCTTCHVYIESGEEFIEIPMRREVDFLKKVTRREQTSRLACQCLLLEGKGNIKLVLPKAGVLS